MYLIICTSNSGSEYLAGVFVRPSPRLDRLVSEKKKKWAKVEIQKSLCFIPLRELHLPSSESLRRRRRSAGA